MAEEPSASSLPRTPTVFVTDAAEESSRVADTLRAAGLRRGRRAARSPSCRASRCSARRSSSSMSTRRGRSRPARLRAEAPWLWRHRLRLLRHRRRVRATPTMRSRKAAAPSSSVPSTSARSCAGSRRSPAVRSRGPRSARPRRRRQCPCANVPPDRSSNPSLPAPGLRTPGPPLPMSVPSLPRTSPIRRARSPRSAACRTAAPRDAELRADAIAQQGADAGPLPSPEEEIELATGGCFASLDEPIEADEDEDHEAARTRWQRRARGHPARTAQNRRPPPAARSTMTTAGRLISTNPAGRSRPIRAVPRRAIRRQRSAREREPDA